MSMSMEGWETVGTNLFLYPVGCQRFVTHSEYLNTTYLQQGSLHIRICKTLYVYFLLIRKGGKWGGERLQHLSFVGLLHRIVSIAKLIWDCIVVGFKLQNPPLDQDFEWLAAIWPLRPDWAVHPYHNPEDEMWMITNFEFEGLFEFCKKYWKWKCCSCGADGAPDWHRGPQMLLCTVVLCVKINDHDAANVFGLTAPITELLCSVKYGCHVWCKFGAFELWVSAFFRVCFLSWLYWPSIPTRDGGGKTVKDRL